MGTHTLIATGTRGAAIELQDPQLGPIAAPAPVPRFQGRTPLHPCVGPDTGQDNQAIYTLLGLSGEDQQRLREMGVI